MNEAPPIKVLLIDVRKLLGEIAQGVFESQQGFRVGSLARSDPGFDSAFDEFGPDVVVVAGEGSSTTASIHDCLLARPKLKVLELRRDGRSVYLYQLTPERHELGATSPERLVSEVRKAVRGSGAPETWGER